MVPPVRFPQSIALNGWVHALSLYTPMLAEVDILPVDVKVTVAVNALYAAAIVLATKMVAIENINSFFVFKIKNSYSKEDALAIRCCLFCELQKYTCCRNFGLNVRYLVTQSCKHSLIGCGRVQLSWIRTTSRLTYGGIK